MNTTPPNAIDPARRRLLVWPLGSALLLLFSLATVIKIDPDLWGHIRFGIDTFTSGLTPIDPYSFTQDKPWINHEWLSELLMGLAWARGGTAGLALLKGVLTAAALAVVWRSLRGADASARLGVMLLVVVGTARLIQTMRPQLWTLLALAVLALVLSTGRWRDRWWLPLLFTVWVNVHGGWVVGLGVLGVWGGVDVLLHPRRLPAAALVGLACVGGTLISPYGVVLWQFVGTTVRMTREIGEWQPLWHAPVLVWLPWSAAAVATALAARREYAGRWQATAVLAMLAYASLRVERILPLFVVCTAILLAPWIRDRWPRRATGIELKPSREEPLAAVGISLVAVAAAVWIGSTSLRCIALDEAWVPDTRVAAVLATAPPGRAVTFFDWGQYALWHLGPRIRVSMDGRRETVYSDERLAEHAAILSGSAAGLVLLQRWRVEYIWLPATSVETREWATANGYDLVVDTEQSFLAVRDDVAGARRAEASFAPCFPG